jgi:hypothetical protein
MATWHVNWAWGLPLIVLTVVIHVLGLGLINEQIVTRMSHRVNPQRLTALFVMVMAAATLMVTALHAIAGIVWAVAYLARISQTSIWIACRFSAFESEIKVLQPFDL